MKKKTVRELVVVGLIVLIGAGALIYIEPTIIPGLYNWQQMRMVDRVMKSDPQILRAAGRELLFNRGGNAGDMAISDPAVPAIIRRLRPSRISFTTNSVSVDFSDVFNPFGFMVFTSDSDRKASGYGPQKWIDGLWLFDDGQLVRYKANN